MAASEEMFRRFQQPIAVKTRCYYTKTGRTISKDILNINPSSLRDPGSTYSKKMMAVSETDFPVNPNNEFSRILPARSLGSWETKLMESCIVSRPSKVSGLDDFCSRRYSCHDNYSCRRSPFLWLYPTIHRSLVVWRKVETGHKIQVSWWDACFWIRLSDHHVEDSR